MAKKSNRRARKSQRTDPTKLKRNDRLTPVERSENMSRIHGRDTRLELLVRSMLHKNGLRFRLHVRSLPGCPDIVLAKYRSVIFVHGCFWHLHENCREGRLPKSNVPFWKKKLEGNRRRDARNISALRALNYSVLVLWGCEIERNISCVESKLGKFLGR